MTLLAAPLLVALTLFITGAFGYVLAGGSLIFLSLHFIAASLLILFYLRKALPLLGRNTVRPLRIVTLVALKTACIFIFGCALLFLLNFWAARSEIFVDVTEAGVFSLADESEAVLTLLKEPVLLRAVAVAKPHERQANVELLKRFREARPDLLTVDEIDPLRDPQAVQQYQLETNDALVLQYGDEAPIRLQEISETSITTALAKVSQGKAERVYFLAGHGEQSITSVAPTGMSKLAELLKQEQVAVETLLLPEVAAVPQDAKALVLAAPQKPLQQSEIEKINAFIDRGGNLLFLAELFSVESLAPLAQRFGVRLEPSVFLELNNNLFEAPEIGWQVTTRNFSDHVLTQGMGDSDLLVFLMASPLRSSDQDMRKFNQQVVVRTSGKTWAETNTDALLAESPQAQFDPEHDEKGAQIIALSAEIHFENEKVSRGLFFGDASWLQNQNISIFANDTFARRSFAWLSSQQQAFVTRPRSFRKSTLLLSSGVFKKLLLLSFILSELLLLFGIFAWARRQYVSATLAAG